MLKGISPVLPPELLSILCEMGHGDTLVIADGNFPAASIAKDCKLVRCDGHGVPEVLKAILKLVPLDQYVEKPVTLMDVVPGDDCETPIWDTYKELVSEVDDRGAEAGIFAGDLFKMYERFIASKGWKTEVLSSSPSDSGGFKTIEFKVTGDKVYSVMKYESGVHRVQRIPKTESQGRIQTSTATVAVLPEADEIDIQIDPTELRIDTYCASSPRRSSRRRSPTSSSSSPRALWRSPWAASPRSSS